LVRAETIADSLHHGEKPYRTATPIDFDADGREEIEITSPTFAAVVKPSDGATLPVLDFRSSAVTLINSLQRRVEAYHSRLQNAAQFAAKVASIHDQTLTKEPGLEKHLKYDRWARNTFRLLLFAPGKTYADFAALSLEESAPFAGGEYCVENLSASEIQLSMEAPLRQVIAGADPDCNLRATKILKFEDRDKGFEARCRVELAPRGPAPPAETPSVGALFTVGLEIVINLLAPNVPDRYIEFAGERKPLEWSGVVEGPQVRLADEWQNVAVEIDACGASQLWVSPIETVSESEEGFERVYQGSQILGVWNVALNPGKPWSAETALRVSAARGS
jgi:alpha-amylase